VYHRLENTLSADCGAPHFGHAGAEVSKFSAKEAEERRFVEPGESSLFGESGAE
jgi:hypothetical protein